MTDLNVVSASEWAQKSHSEAEKPETNVEARLVWTSDVCISSEFFFEFPQRMQAAY